jgi:hypothetical protein
MASIVAEAMPPSSIRSPAAASMACRAVSLRGLPRGRRSVGDVPAGAAPAEDGPVIVSSSKQNC